MAARAAGRVEGAKGVSGVRLNKRPARVTRVLCMNRVDTYWRAE